MNVAIGHDALAREKVKLTPEQERLERAALKFVREVRGGRCVANRGHYVASGNLTIQPYGKISRESVRNALIAEVNADDRISDRIRLARVKRVEQWIESHIELIGEAAFCGE
jgi:hypothetical protein